MEPEVQAVKRSLEDRDVEDAREENRNEVCPCQYTNSVYTHVY